MFAEAREHDGFDPNTMFSQGVDLNEAYKGSPGMRRGAVAPGVDYQVDRSLSFGAGANNLFDETVGVFRLCSTIGDLLT